MEYYVTVRNGKKRTYDAREALHASGFSYDPKRNLWRKESDSEAEVRSEAKAWKRRGFTTAWSASSAERGSSYRKDFFSHSEPFFKDRYFCIYCGLPIKKENVQVDHIIPVSATTKSPRIRKRIERKGWSSVNDYHNLGASCARCNRKKGASCGLWVVRGRTGKSNAFQIVRWCIRAAIFAILILCGTGIIFAIRA